MTDSEPISPRPSLPPALENAIKTRELVVFVGAGASKIAGSPLWDELAHQLLRRLIDERRVLREADFDQLRTLAPRTKVTLAQILAQPPHRIEREEWGKLLRPRSEDGEANGHKLYRALSLLTSAFVTTNYDDWLDLDLATGRDDVEQTSGRTIDQPARAIAVRPKDFFSTVAEESFVVHLHGSTTDPESMILTTPQYLNHYSYQVAESQINPVVEFLEHLFGSKNVLFVGYSLDELEILEFVLRKGRKNRNDEVQTRRWILQGFFSHQTLLVNHLRTYFNAFGVDMIPFSLDDGGWPQLIDVLENFASKAQPGERLELQERLEMRRFADALD